VIFKTIFKCKGSLAALDHSLAGGAWLVGERLTIAELAVYAYYTYHLARDCGINLSTYPAVRRVSDHRDEPSSIPHALDPRSQATD
jgi:glutathione S-transferase